MFLSTRFCLRLNRNSLAYVPTHNYHNEHSYSPLIDIWAIDTLNSYKAGLIPVTSKYFGAYRPNNKVLLSKFVENTQKKVNPKLWRQNRGCIEATLINCESSLTTLCVLDPKTVYLGLSLHKNTFCQGFNQEAQRKFFPDCKSKRSSAFNFVKKLLLQEHSN